MVVAVLPGGHVDEVARAAVELSHVNGAPIRFICLSSLQPVPNALQPPEVVFDQTVWAMRHGDRHRRGASHRHAE